MMVGRQLARKLHGAVAARQSQKFLDAAKAVQSLSEQPPPDVKLKLYALYKQATKGQNTSPKPPLFAVVEKAKWEAHTALGNMSREEAEAQYIALCKQLGAATPTSTTATAAPQSSEIATAAPQSSESGDKPSGAPAKYTTITLSTTKSGVRTITMTRPDKRNALSWDMYREIMAALLEAAHDDGVQVVVLTGAGDFYSSGNDLTNFTRIPPEGPAKMADDAKALMAAYVGCFINFPKPLVAAVNGPAVGLPVTTLPLFDLVYASHRATFHAPLVALGQTPEGCSSLTFPALMGYARAVELLVLGRKVTAEEARDRYGLVNDVFEHGQFEAAVAERTQALAGLPPQAVLKAKALLRGTTLSAKEGGGAGGHGTAVTASPAPGQAAAALHAANAREADVIKDCWLGPEVQAAVMAFLSKGGGGGKGQALK